MGRCRNNATRVNQVYLGDVVFLRKRCKYPGIDLRRRIYAKGDIFRQFKQIFIRGIQNILVHILKVEFYKVVCLGLGKLGLKCPRKDRGHKKARRYAYKKPALKRLRNVLQIVLRAFFLLARQTRKQNAGKHHRKPVDSDHRERAGTDKRKGCTCVGHIRKEYHQHMYDFRNDGSRKAIIPFRLFVVKHILAQNSRKNARKHG